MRVNRPLPYEFTLVLLAGVAQQHRMPGEQHGGLRAVRLHAFGHDESRITTPAAPKLGVQAKIVPSKQAEAFGGDMYHTLVAAPTPGGDNRHWIPLGIDTKPDESVLFTIVAAEAGTYVFRVVRELIFDPATPIEFFGT